MTTIAAVRAHDAWLMACDTMAASGDGRAWSVETKLTVLDGRHRSAVVGSSGHRMIQPAILAVDSSGLDIEATDDDLEPFVHGLVQRWTEDLYEALRERHVPVCDDGLIDAAQLLAYRGRLWMLTDGLAEPIAAEWTAVGSGADLALGYLEAAAQHVQPEEALRGAIACAVRYDTGSGGHAHVVALDDDGTARELDT